MSRMFQKNGKYVQKKVNGVKVMTVLEVLETYCKNCAHRDKCWRPCAVAMSALINDEKHREEPVKT